MTIGVILMTYGAPAGDGDVAAYLGRVRGHPPAPELVTEMRRRYGLIGGSPLVEITHAPRAAPNSADDEIVRRLRTDPAPETIRVVTSDNALADQARFVGASVEPAETFRNRLADP